MQLHTHKYLYIRTAAELEADANERRASGIPEPELEEEHQEMSVIAAASALVLVSSAPTVCIMSDDLLIAQAPLGYASDVILCRLSYVFGFFWCGVNWKLMTL